MGVWAKGPAVPHRMTDTALPAIFRLPGALSARGVGYVLAGVAACALGVLGVQKLIAQVEGERGIAPIASSTDIQVSGIEVNVTGKTADEARREGWKEAQRKAWESLKGPKMGDEQIDSMVSAVVIEHEQIGPRRYVARLGVIFDRAKAGQYLSSGAGGSLATSHSAPLLVIPVLYSGGASQVFEVRGAWQRAWANFQTAASPIDYVRPSGGGGDSLLITSGQPGRRSRLWWRTVLDQFGAADVITPVAQLRRQWPGGPVRGTFTARYGPDNTFLETFSLSANSEEGVPRMMADAVVRMDRIYSQALGQGLLQPDPTLQADQSAFAAAMAKILAAAEPEAAKPTDASSSATPSATDAKPTEAAVVTSITVQFASPDAAAVDAALGAVRSAPGVRGAATTSIAIGGTSVMSVSFAGDPDQLASALRARGYSVSGGGRSLSIRR